MDNQIPKAPNLAMAASKFRELMGDNPNQATQIMTALGVVKHAKEGSYEQYCLMCSSLGIEPGTEQQWDAHDKTLLRKLIAASLKSNLPNCPITAEDIDELLTLSVDSKNKLDAGKAMIKIIMKAYGASDDVEKSWADLGQAALNLFM